jgi:hypothetical protein
MAPFLFGRRCLSGEILLPQFPTTFIKQAGLPRRVVALT